MIDAEGHDVNILVSMLQHCNIVKSEFPEVIMFESRGHCDVLQHTAVGSAEADIIASLQNAGYRLLSYSYGDTFLVWNQSSRPELSGWLNSWVCYRCNGRRTFPQLFWGGRYYCSACAAHCALL